MSNTYCVVFLFCFSSFRVPYVVSSPGLSIFCIAPSVFSEVYVILINMEQQCVYIGWWSHTMTHDNTLERGYPVLGRGQWKILVYCYTHVSLVEQELLTLPEHLSSPPVFSVVHVTRSLVFFVMFCRSLFVLLYFFFWPLCCLFFFDIRILITLLVSLKSTYENESDKLEELEDNI